MTEPKKRCAWTGDDPLMILYHDTEWGEPVHDDRKLFEFMVLNAFQAGLNWKTILYKREQFRKAFAQYDVQKVARFDAAKVETLMQDTSIIRNRQKINASVANAQLFLQVQKEFGSFDQYIWQFSGHKTLHNKWKSREQVPATSAVSDAMSADMRRRGFKFAGSIICYALMQAAGMVNDHETGCFRHKELITQA